ncbi:MAG TPA: hypothetical protein VFZ46_00870 [Nitrososphaeraceae archaeon]
MNYKIVSKTVRYPRLNAITNQVNILWMSMKKKERRISRKDPLSYKIRRKDTDRLSNKNNAALLLEFPPSLKVVRSSDRYQNDVLEIL